MNGPLQLAGALAACLAAFACSRTESAAGRPPVAATDGGAAMEADGAGAAGAESGPLATLVDAPISAADAWLLERAFDAVSRMPLVPHGKNRARAQGLVIDALLEHGQRRRAYERAARIENWRKGLAYAAIAVDSARRGEAAAARALLAQAEAVHADAVAAEEQGWRADRLLATMLEARCLLGEGEAAAREEGAIDKSEVGRIAIARVRGLAREDLDAQLAELGRLVATGDFDQARTAIGAAVALHERFHDDEGARERLETFVAASWGPLPIDQRLAALEGLVATASSRGTAAHLRARVAELAAAAAAARWTDELAVPVEARLARLEHATGDSEAALDRLAAAQERYERGRERIYDVFRAGVLRPLGEAFAAVGEFESARSVLRQALEEGAQNPNARPRAEDLAATCCALARCFDELAADDRERIERIAAGLTAPW